MSWYLKKKSILPDFNNNYVDFNFYIEINHNLWGNLKRIL